METLTIQDTQALVLVIKRLRSKVEDLEKRLQEVEAAPRKIVYGGGPRSFSGLAGTIADAQTPNTLLLAGSRKAEKIDIDGGVGQYDRIYTKNACIRVHPTLNYIYFYNRAETDINSSVFLNNIYLDAFRPRQTMAQFLTGAADKTIKFVGFKDAANYELMWIKNEYVYLKNLPVADPSEAGALWNDGGTIKISSG